MIWQYIDVYYFRLFARYKQKYACHTSEPSTSLIMWFNNIKNYFRMPPEVSRFRASYNASSYARQLINGNGWDFFLIVKAPAWGRHGLCLLEKQYDTMCITKLLKGLTEKLLCSSTWPTIPWFISMTYIDEIDGLINSVIYSRWEGAGTWPWYLICCKRLYEPNNKAFHRNVLPVETLYTWLYNTEKL